MKTDEILQGNKLIAEFLKGKHPILDDINILKYPFTIYKMQFHSSWDWLMPVVEKIESCFDGNVEFDIKSNGWVIISLGSQYALTRHDIELYIKNKGETKIESIWLAVIDFIKFYNQNK